jgi:phosphate transport system substrate-binding protein
MKKAIYPICLYLSGMMLLSCNRDPEKMEGPTIGKLQIMADENLQYIVQQEEEVFENNYKYALLDISYAAEQDVFNALLNDSIDAVIASRRLTAEELKFLDGKQQHPREFEFATSAIAFIRHQQSADTVIVYEDLLNQMRDEQSGAVFVLEDAKSGIATTLLDVLDLENLPAHFFALNTKAEVLTYIEQHPESIGIIDYSEISDSDSAYAREVLKKIQLVGISRPADSLQMGFIRPFQYNLQDNIYPFTRDLYFISNSGKSDVGIGFATFICAEIGQKIILKAGLLPTYQTERIIEINPTTDIKVVQ